jgi:hypothetical protein
LNPIRGRRFSLLYTHPDWHWAHLHSAAVGTGALLGYEVAMCAVDCLVPRPGASDDVLLGELYLYVTELIRCVHKIAKSDY